ncbi:unnamed protein product, partial [Rotaria magnacalcarata]
MLKDHIIPQLEEHSAFQIMIWQQDDAPLHCDLTPYDLSLWGIMKYRVYAQSPRDANHLKSLIKQKITSLNDNIELCQTICQSVADRCQMCINAGG